MNVNGIPANLGEALEVLGWREERIEVLKETIERMDGEMTQKDKRIAALEALLREIAEHPHRIDGCSNRIDETAYNLGTANGHRCAAEIARKALGDRPKEE